MSFFIDWDTIFVLWENLSLLHHDILSSSILLRRGKEEGESKSLSIERRIKNKFREYTFRGTASETYLFKYSFGAIPIYLKKK